MYIFLPLVAAFAKAGFADIASGDSFGRILALCRATITAAIPWVGGCFFVAESWTVLQSTDLYSEDGMSRYKQHLLWLYLNQLGFHLFI